MGPKGIIIVGTMAFTITISAGLGSAKVNAYPLESTSHLILSEEINPQTHNPPTAKKGDLLEVLGLTSDDQIYDALYDGKTLAEIAEERQADAQKVVDLQVAEMTEQLDRRLAVGSLTYMQYHAQKSELEHIVKNSVYGLKN